MIKSLCKQTSEYPSDIVKAAVSMLSKSLGHQVILRDPKSDWEIILNGFLNYPSNLKIKPNNEKKVEYEKEEMDDIDSLIDPEILDEEFDDGYDQGYNDTSDEISESLVLEDKKDTIVSKNENYIYSKGEDTRSRLATLYTVLTFLIFFLGMFIAVLDGLVRRVSIIDNLEIVIPLISGVFLGTLGFVLGYYFRKEEEKDK